MIRASVIGAAIHTRAVYMLPLNLVLKDFCVLLILPRAAYIPKITGTYSEAKKHFNFCTTENVPPY